MNAVHIGLLGLGTVGGGTLDVLHRNAGEISRRAGRAIRVTRAAVRDTERPRDSLINRADGAIKITDDALAIAADPDIEVVVELIGGDGVALDAVMAAIENGKHIVTANKALIALHGNEIFDAAQKRGVMVAFEAAVAGGIPIIKSIREGLAANRIQYLAGIINGTANFILSRMFDAGDDPVSGHGAGFDEVLAEAQREGYAEADPAFDIDGVDAAHKLTILASIAFGIPLQFERVFVEGITGVTVADINYARELGYRIKHLGIARRVGDGDGGDCHGDNGDGHGDNGNGHGDDGDGAADGIELRVHPTLIPHQRLIANVDGVMNAVLVRADAVGATLYYGAGAGAEPTASAVVADLVDVVRAITTDPQNRVPHLAFQPGTLAAAKILPMDEVTSAYYLRMSVTNRPGVLAAIARIFGDRQISIDTVLQKGGGDEVVTVIMLTQQTRERRMNDALKKIAQLDSVRGDIVRIRLEKLI